MALGVGVARTPYRPRSRWRDRSWVCKTTAGMSAWAHTYRWWRLASAQRWKSGDPCSSSPLLPLLWSLQRFRRFMLFYPPIPNLQVICISFTTNDVFIYFIVFHTGFYHRISVNKYTRFYSVSKISPNKTSQKIYIFHTVPTESLGTSERTLWKKAVF
jgi:hypothetical protein